MFVTGTYVFVRLLYPYYTRVPLLPHKLENVIVINTVSTIDVMVNGLRGTNSTDVL